MVEGQLRSSSALSPGAYVLAVAAAAPLVWRTRSPLTALVGVAVAVLTGFSMGWTFAASIGFDVAAMKLLEEYPWPGNVRELENTIERAMVLSDSTTLRATDLPDRVREPADPVAAELARGDLSIKRTTRAIEQVLIKRALERTKGNRTRAAELLEISHRALLYKIKEYGIT